MTSQAWKAVDTTKLSVLVTGATGLVGHAIVRRAIETHKEWTICALVRDEKRAQPMLPGSVRLMRGDVTDVNSLEKAMVGIHLVFHAAGLPEQYQADDAIFHRVNAIGTRNVVEAALKVGVKRVVHTSTMDVFAAERGGTLVETNLDSSPKPTAYERSKVAAEKYAEETRKKGLEVVYVNPAGVYGPNCPVNTGLNDFILQMLRGEVPMLPPGGMTVVYADRVADAHIQAALTSADGERYLCGDEYADTLTLAKQVSEAAAAVAKELKDEHPIAVPVPSVAPLWLVRFLAAVTTPVARCIGKQPLVAGSILQFLQWEARVDSRKAIRQLSFITTPLQQGLRALIKDYRLRRVYVPQQPNSIAPKLLLLAALAAGFGWRLFRSAY